MYLRWLWRLALSVALVHGLGGCASAPGTADGARVDRVTESDEAPERKRARIRLELALGYFQDGKTTIALDEVKQALVVSPDYADAHNLRGLIYMRLGDLGLAHDSFKRALSLRPNDPNVLHNQGWLQCQQAQYAAAQASFELALAQPQYPERVKTWLTLGLCQARAGQDAAALASLIKSYELDAANPVTGYNLAQILVRQGELARAQFYIQRVNTGPWANAESLWLGAQVAQRLGQSEAARQWASQLMQRYPDSAQAQRARKGAYDD